jgi:hypothetical protein
LSGDLLLLKQVLHDTTMCVFQLRKLNPDRFIGFLDGQPDLSFTILVHDLTKKT